ncbi:uncharacterized protein [Battus philenor]|uniref:uncharacterized protein n=1 Tax=Battus philenor TaxID=42288 RepID=UPI0035D02511
MADAAAARREARRRRILENSHNRLQLISGKIEDEFIKDSPRRTPIPDQIVDVPLITEVNTINTCFLNNGVLNSDLETTGYTSEIQQQTNDREVTNDLAAFLSSPETTPTQDPSLVDKIVNYKYDIVLLSLLMQLLNGLSIINIESSYFFLPLFLYVVTKLIFFPKQNNSNIANAFLLLNGISAEKVKIVMFIMQVVMVISQDVCIFLFTTICIQSMSTIQMKNFIS